MPRTLLIVLAALSAMILTTSCDRPPKKTLKPHSNKKSSKPALPTKPPSAPLPPHGPSPPRQKISTRQSPSTPMTP